MRAQVRRELGRRSTKAFCEIYLRHHFPTPWGEHHDDLFEAIDSPKTGKRICRAEPRKFGKTTIVGLAQPLKALAYRTKNFILMIGESSGSAESNLQSIIDEVENNDLLLEDFPHLAPAIDRKGQLVKWTDRQLVFQSQATIVAKGMGGRMRGLKRLRFRPDLAILDDPESPETSDTFSKRKRHKRWFGGTFMGLGAADWDVFVIGNLVHHDSLIAELLKSSAWDSKLYRALNTQPREGFPYPLGNRKTDGSPMWPEGWPAEKLEAYRAEPTVGSLVFNREMMNEPREDEDQKFDSGQFEFFDFTPAMLASYEAIATFIDPAGGQKQSDARSGKKDFAAIVTAAKQNGHIDIIDARMTKELPSKQIEIVLDVYDQFRGEVGAEENIYKNLLKENIEKAGKARGLLPAVRAVHQTQNKITRILSIQPQTENRTIRFARHLLQTCPELFRQFDEFPGDHEDGPDATEGAFRLLEAPAWTWGPAK